MDQTASRAVRRGGPETQPGRSRLSEARALCARRNDMEKIAMGLFDSILGAAHDHPTLKNMADKLGIDQRQAEQAIAALGEAHHQPGDTVEMAAQKTGLSAATLSQIVDQIGGEGSLAQFSQMLDADHDGNPFDDIGRLFGRE
jgi:hypothetical protein